jgi:hypothetical protein
MLDIIYSYKWRVLYKVEAFDICIVLTILFCSLTRAAAVSDLALYTNKCSLQTNVRQ